VALSIEDVTSALSSVMDPELRAPITTLDMVGDISVSDSSLAVEIRLTIVGCPAADTIERDVRQALSGGRLGRAICGAHCRCDDHRPSGRLSSRDFGRASPPPIRSRQTL